jgi:ribosome-associated protein
MRTEDHETIAQRVALLDTTSAAYNKLFHQLEIKRDALIGENSKEVLSQYLDDNPNLEEIQLLRQLIRLSQKEASQEGNTSNRKKLFRLLREVEEKRLGLKG